MKQFNEFVGCSVGTATSAVGTTLQTDMFLQRVSIIITIVGGIITILIGAIALAKSIRSWWKKASEDGEITKEEIKEGVEIIRDGLEPISKGAKQIQQTLDDKKEEER